MNLSKASDIFINLFFNGLKLIGTIKENQETFYKGVALTVIVTLFGACFI